MKPGLKARFQTPDIHSHISTEVTILIVIIQQKSWLSVMKPGLKVGFQNLDIHSHISNEITILIVIIQQKSWLSVMETQS